MAQGETEPGASGAIQLLAANANAALAEKVAAALKRAGYRIDRGPFDPDRVDAAVALWTADAVNIPALVEEARRAFTVKRLTTISIGGVEPPFGAQEIAPINLAGWRGEDDDPRWRFVLADIETLKVRAELEPAEPVFSAIAPSRAAPPGPGPAAVRPLVASRAAAPDPVSADPALAGPESGEIDSIDDLFTDQPVAPHHPARTLWRRRVLPAAPLIAGAFAVLGLAAAGYVAATWRGGAPASSDPAPQTQEAPMAADGAGEADEPAPGADLALLRLRPGAPNPEAQEAAAQSAAAESSDRVADAAGDALVESPVDAAPEDVEAQAEVPPEILPEDAAEDALAAAGPAAPSLKPVAADEPAAAPEATATALNEAALEELAAAAASKGGAEDRSHGGFFTDCAGCPDMAALDGGAFLMGARPGEEDARVEETPQRRVEIGYRFAIATRETTFDQWMACVEDSGCRAYFPYDEGWGRGDRPVINVSYEDASAYARWLSAKTGRYYRLPSEAEWEFAARAGTGGAFFSGETMSAGLANFDGRSPYRAEPGVFRGRTVPVTQFGHNAFGLFDMHGNVAEWTLDCWAPGHHGGPATGAARIGGDCSRRVVKGGAWNAPAADLRAAARRGADPETRSSDVGFRVVRELD